MHLIKKTLKKSNSMVKQLVLIRYYLPSPVIKNATREYFMCIYVLVCTCT